MRKSAGTPVDFSAASCVMGASRKIRRGKEGVPTLDPQDRAIPGSRSPARS
ncbi:hypothetical protein [Leptospira adleri]|uniref:hypothetical protein n=1 Tax=Leptospira adleri TaxID=2023186 RepID=UPI0013FDAB52|nr:hypothetical protein [Leptospira adleri]